MLTATIDKDGGNKYPFVGKYKCSDKVSVILFTKLNTGTVIYTEDEDNYVGQHSINWREDKFECTTITLSSN